MDCYALETVHECDTPMLLSVSRAYILTMHATETFPWLHGVARRTYVQRNRGFRACFKTRGDGQRVDATNQDIIHAYRAVFERERDTRNAYKQASHRIASHDIGCEVLSCGD